MTPAKKTARSSRTLATSRPRKKAPAAVHIVSDATGILARHVINAVLTQFPNLSMKQVYHTFVETEDDIDAILKTIKSSKDLVLFGLVDPDQKTRLSEACADRKIASFDLTGSLVQFIADHTHTAPVNERSRLHEADAGYFQRIAAMEFTAQHDDGRRIESIDQAEIVITGLSRVSKSPTATFLGSMGYKVANVSISKQTGFPPELRKVKKRTVAFTVAPIRLYETRARRFEQFKDEIRRQGLEDLGYYDKRAVIEEVVYAEHEYRKRGYPIVDITGKTVEEISVTVLRLLKIRHKNNIQYDH